MPINSYKYCIIILLHLQFLYAPLISDASSESLVLPYINPCVKNLKDLAAANAKNSYNSYIEIVKDTFRVHYMETCKHAMENLKMVYNDKEYHFTLYYYDQAGNLIKTVPPEGVVLVTDANDLDQIALDRSTQTHTFFTKHTLQTRYEYNSLNQLIRQATPDNELMNNDYSSRFWYDRLGRLVVSQNTKQFNKTPKAYSYTKYDTLGRIIEVGETAIATDIASLTNTHGVIGDNAAFDSWLATGVHTEITYTLYDAPVSPAIPGFTQENLRKRVSATFIDDNGDGINEQGSLYNYDIHGNVKSLLQENKALENVIVNGVKQSLKRIDYEYDLVSGNVNAIHYQNGEPDQFHHKYEYDADNRITNVYTSNDNVIWEQDQKLFYYAHGPLARVELGDNKVQGMDYAYTIQGWVKGVNSETLLASRDIGKDGDNSMGNVNKNISRDAFGYSLGYFNGDYKPIGSIAGIDNFIAGKIGSDLMASGNDLFNGNISNMVTTITDIHGLVLPNAMVYKYDQLNRISEAKGFANIDVVKNKWQDGSTYNGRYYNNYSFDANGNILTALVKNDAGTIIDAQTYNYQTIDGKRVSNKLYAITDNATATGGFDLPSTQAPFNNTQGTINTVNNYGYSEIGELKFDTQNKILEIKRRVDGNITEITRTPGSGKANLKYSYDAYGKRVAKHIYTNAGVWLESEYYIRDASGNIMSTYKYSIDDQTNIASFKQTERYMYGSSLLGIDKTTTELIRALPPDINYSRTLGHKQYSLQNHLHNDLLVVSDRRIPNDVTADGVIDFYTADILLARDYGVYGEYLTNRGFNLNNYPNSFNDKPDDEELFGWQNYGYRNYIKGRRGFDRTDPLFKDYPELTPYQFASNSPIENIDRDGLEKWKANISNIDKCWDGTGGVKIKPKRNLDIKGAIKDFNNLLHKKPKLGTDDLSGGNRSIGKAKKGNKPETSSDPGFIEIDGIRIVNLPEIEIKPKDNNPTDVKEQIEKKDPGATQGGEHEKQDKIDIIKEKQSTPQKKDSDSSEKE